AVLSLGLRRAPLQRYSTSPMLAKRQAQAVVEPHVGVRLVIVILGIVVGVGNRCERFQSCFQFRYPGQGG
ncbi:hypothetical protein M8864_33960, partial [Pseudomonas aeruginosa]|uniref:hypothetical protein n=1 Tax=Pseudomonas aeruginosa TaxID=287 RepID=UPI002021FED7